MNAFAKHAEVLSSFSIEGDYPEIEKALEAAIDALALAFSISQNLRINGAPLSDDPTPQEIEAVYDSQSCELRAAAVLLADYEDSVDRCATVGNEITQLIKQGKNLDVRIVDGYFQLRKRIQQVQAACELADEISL